MLRWALVLGFLLLGSSCSSNKFGEEHNYTCDTASGTYLTHWTTKSGNCGDVADGIVNTQSAGENATYQDDTVSNDNCTITTDYTYTDPQTSAKYQVASVVECQDQQCDKLKEEATITVYYDYQTCTGTYEITWTKQ